MLEPFLGKSKMLFKSPMTLLIYSILSKWYITIFITAIVVAYWVFKGLDSAGILQKTQETVFDALNQTKSVAKYCIPKITHFGNFWDCLQDPPTYAPGHEEIQLEESIKKAIAPSRSNIVKDPYSNEE